jgi:predicted MFS family arabinose efflux permease
MAGSVEQGRQKGAASLAILTLASSLAFIDRQVLSLVQESIKHELNVTDAQLGLLTGFAFVILYIGVGVPLARFADRWVRRDIIVLSMLAWSAMTVLTSFARNYTHLLVCRIGVGLGEAGCNPSALSMIADLFGPRRRATAMAIHSTNANIGMLLGLVIGGWLNQYLGWRTTFLLLGIPGLLFAIIVRLTLREPARAQPVAGSDATLGLWATLATLAAHATLRRLALAVGVSTIISYGTLNWTAPYLIRAHGMQTGAIGTWLGLIVGIGGGLGSIGGGMLTDRLARRDVRWRLWVPATVSLVMIPFLILGYTRDTTFACLALLALPYCTMLIFSGASLSVVHAIAPEGMRATASAMFFVMTNIVGVGIGSWLIGWTSDRFRPATGALSIEYALLLIVPSAAALAALLYFWAAAAIRQDLEMSSSSTGT